MKKTVKYWAFVVLSVVLTIVLGVLKFTGTIALSWWWIFSPILIPFSLSIAVVIIALVIARYYSRELKKKQKK